VVAVTVFVDDAVLGRLPPVCVKDGIGTGDRLTFTQDVDAGGRTGLGVAWLLLLAGPLGWIGLLVIAATRRSAETLTVTLPYCEAAHVRMQRALRALRRAAVVLCVALVVAFLALLPRTTGFRLMAVGLAVVACGALVRVIVESVRLNRAMVHIGLDASRRWVTIWGVHPVFLAAVERERHSSYAARLA
jgi:hypothetical protein